MKRRFRVGPEFFVVGGLSCFRRYGCWAERSSCHLDTSARPQHCTSPVSVKPQADRSPQPRSTKSSSVGVGACSSSSSLPKSQSMPPCRGEAKEHALGNAQLLVGAGERQVHGGRETTRTAVRVGATTGLRTTGERFELRRVGSGGDRRDPPALRGPALQPGTCEPVRTCDRVGPDTWDVGPGDVGGLESAAVNLVVRVDPARIRVVLCRSDLGPADLLDRPDIRLCTTGSLRTSPPSCTVLGHRRVGRCPDNSCCSPQRAESCRRRLWKAAASYEARLGVPAF